MHVIILAAGVGSRLRPETDRVPKCLVPIGDETFLTRLIRQYSDCGLERITVVCGYRIEDVRAQLSKTGQQVQLVDNRLYDSTNNMFSLVLGLLPTFKGPTIFGNADVVYDEDLIREFITSAPLNSIPVDVGEYLDESMKVELGPGGRISSISKGIAREVALGNSLDVYKLSADATSTLRQLIITDYLVKGRLKEWSEVALNDLLGREAFTPWDTRGRWWVEVDTMEDLQQARHLVASNLRVSQSRK